MLGHRIPDCELRETHCWDLCIYILGKMSVIVDQYFSLCAFLSDPVQIRMGKKKRRSLMLFLLTVAMTTPLY